MRDSSEGQRSSHYPSSTSSPPSPCPWACSIQRPELPPSPKSSPPDYEFKKQSRELFQRLQSLRGREWIGEESNQKFTVTPAQWLALQDELSLNHDKLHCHYNAQNQILEVKMPCAIHDHIASKFATLLMKKLAALIEELGANDALRAIIEKIETTRELEVKVFKAGTRHPDVAIHSGDYPPSCVIEVGHRQSGRNEFDEIADNYIGGTDGGIKTMVGLDMEYRTPEQRETLRDQPRKATYQIYRSCVNNEGQLFVESRKGAISFQSEEGAVDSRTHLRLNLADLTQSASVDLSGYNIEISHEELCKIIDAGEAMQERVDKYAFIPSRPFVHKNKAPSDESQDHNTSRDDEAAGSTEQHREERKRKRARTVGKPGEDKEWEEQVQEKVNVEVKEGSKKQAKEVIEKEGDA